MGFGKAVTFDENVYIINLSYNIPAFYIFTLLPGVFASAERDNSLPPFKKTFIFKFRLKVNSTKQTKLALINLLI